MTRVSNPAHKTSLVGAAGWSLSILAVVLSAATIWAQTVARTPEAPAAVPQPTPKDALGRETPRSTVLGFLNAARRGENDLASQYLDTKLTGDAAATLSQQLFAVLDARLPARLTQLSEAPEGSRANPLMPHRELVGVIASASGNVDIVVDRVSRGTDVPIWLFSRDTLDALPALYQEIVQGRGDGYLTRLLTSIGVRRMHLVEWGVVLLGLPLFYIATLTLNRLLTPLLHRSWRRLFETEEYVPRDLLSAPVRLLLLAFAIRWVQSNVSLSLVVRQFWVNASRLMTIVAVVWLLILLNGQVETYVRRRFAGPNAAVTSLLRLLRRGADALVIVAGLFALLRLLTIDPTPALAGLGVGGIAVALAAQKTLENVIAGASLIFDQAVRVGDFLKMGEVLGTVDRIGLRSTRLRTLDRTIVSVPNSQIANVTLETISARDKYWFHPIVGLRYDTTPQQLRSVVHGIRTLLETHPTIDRESVRVRFLRLGSFSLDVDVFAYVFARDWPHFLEIQEQLLFSVADLLDRIGARIALPSQTTYVASAHPPDAITPKVTEMARASNGLP